MAKKSKAKSKAKATASAKVETPSATIREEAIAAVLSSVNQAVRSKVCRLCETKDGPFLQIFSPDKVLSKKMQELLPFVISETDGLPHKICFRCSAKVEELHEFIQKCLKTQYSLNKTYGLKEEVIMKTNTRKMWEEKLNKSNMSNDDICDALIKKAMEGITDLPINKEISNKAEPAVLKEKLDEHKEITKLVETATSQDVDQMDEGTNNVKLMKDVKISLNKIQNSRQDDHVPLVRTTRASKAESKNSEIKIENVNTEIDTQNENSENKLKNKNETQILTENVSNKQQEKTSSFQMDFIDLEKCTEKKEKPFDIMDHVTSIKVNGVGFLFQCKLCNRNFLKKEVVLSHACAKTGVPKVDCFKSVVSVEQPRNPQSNIKFITRKVPDTIKESTQDEILKKNVDIEAPKEIPPPKPKPKIGPASKVKKQNDVDSSPSTSMNSVCTTNPPSQSSTVAPVLPVPVHIPGMVNRFKLLPGPNNSFTLVEDVSMLDVPNVIKKTVEADPKPSTIVDLISRKSTTKDNNISNQEINVSNQEIISTIVDLGVKTNKKSRKSTTKGNNVSNHEIIDLEDDSIPGVKSSHVNSNIPSNAQGFSKGQPYPVGLFQTIPRPQPSASASFATPAMKKQSYTVVQTGDPSKLVISTKTQSISESCAEPTVTSKVKKNKKSKVVIQDDKKEQPFNVTIEDAAPQQPFNSQLFSFVNVDPLLQPSYVLPTNNIIQESQITTSTPTNKSKDVYPCHLCTEVFKSEKKYLSHIQVHYDYQNKSDNGGVSARKRSRRS